MKDTIIFYREWWEALKDADERVRLEVYAAIMEYSFAGKLPNLKQNAGTVFALIRPQLDRDAKKYKAQAENGARGGAPKGNNNAKKNNPKTTQKQPKTTQNNPNVDVDVDVDIDVDINPATEVAERARDGVTFDAFWDAYGYKKDRASAERTWNRLSQKDRRAAYDGIEAYRADCQAHDRQMMYAQGYMTHRRWEDEVTAQTPPPDGGGDAESCDKEWQGVCRWRDAQAPHLSFGRGEYMEMRAAAHFRASAIREILLAIARQPHVDSVLAEFKRLCNIQPYMAMIWDDGSK